MIKRFCTTCQRKKPEAGGYKQPGLCRGWRCEDCMNKRSVSPYLSKKNLTYAAKRESDAQFQAVDAHVL